MTRAELEQHLNAQVRQYATNVEWANSALHQNVRALAAFASENGVTDDEIRHAVEAQQAALDVALRTLVQTLKTPKRRMH